LPWDLLGPGKPLPDIFRDPKYKAWELGYGKTALPFSDDTKTKIAVSIANPNAGDAYPVQVHHLIPVSSFGTSKNLDNNACLLNLNINDANNCILLPELSADVHRHDLQIHRGSHPTDYKKTVDQLFNNIEKKMCFLLSIRQKKKLIQDLNKLSNDIEKAIRLWDSDYLIHNFNPMVKKRVDEITKGEIQ